MCGRRTPESNVGCSPAAWTHGVAASRSSSYRGPATVRSSALDFLDSYVNFYPAEGAVITAQFGDRDADAAAAAVLTDLFPGREVVQLDVDRLHGGGGGIHCVTQQEPAAG